MDKRVLKTYYALGGDKSRKKLLDAYSKYVNSFRYGTGARFHSGNGKSYWDGGPTEEQLSDFITSIGATAASFGAPNSSKRLGYKIYNSPDDKNKWATTVGIAGALGRGLIDGLDTYIQSDSEVEHNPFKKIGLYDWGGALNVGSSAFNILNGAIGNAQLTTKESDVKDSIDKYSNNLNQLYAGVSDNDALLNAFDQSHQITSGLTGRDFRNKSGLSDTGDALGSALEGFGAGMTFGPVGGIIGGVVGGVSSLIGSNIGRNKARRAAARQNAHIEDINNSIDTRLASLTDKVDQQNDLKRMQAFMNMNFGAYGGELSTHGDDFSNGLTFINTGGTHEENPYGGVPAGVDENGDPNLVEQDEVIWDDYVFSNRIEVPDSLREKYKLKEGTTFADAVKKLTEPSLERPNNHIDKETNKAILQEFMGAQEEVRAQMQAKEAEALNKAYQEDQDLLALALAEQEQSPLSFPGQEMMVPEQASPEMFPQEGFAFGGNLFKDGSRLDRSSRRNLRALEKLQRQSDREKERQIRKEIRDKEIEARNWDKQNGNLWWKRLHNNNLDFDRRDLATIGAGISAAHGLLTDPNFSDEDAVLAEARRMQTPISFPVETLGDYISPNPIDERRLVNLYNARTNAALRSGINTSGGNRAMQLGMASSLALDEQDALSRALAQLHGVNRADKFQVGEFNRGTRQFNASALNTRNQYLAGLNSQRQAQGLSAGITGRQMRVNKQALWDQNTATSLNTFLDNLGLYGKEKAGDQIINSMAENGILPYGYTRDGRGYQIALSPNYGMPIYWTPQQLNPDGTVKEACGGKIKRKRRF